MSHAIGPARALEMIIEGRGLEAEEAERIGLINRAVAKTKLLGEAQRLAERMARRSPASIAGAKHSVYFGATAPLPAGLATERRWFLSSGTTPQARRGLSAYADQVAESGRAPAVDPELRAAWQDGTMADLVSGD
jgi:enoyl-CoA hydratase/carnithine racemase